MSEVTPRPIKWLWPGRIPAHRLTLLVGDPDQGKSLLLCDFASRITCGTAWPDGTACPSGKVLFLSCEDDLEDTVAPRLLVHRAALEHIRICRTRNEAVVLNELRTPGLVACFIDPLSYFLPDNLNPWHEKAVRTALTNLTTLAQQTRVTIIALVHLTKAEQRTKLFQVLGSVAFTAVPRSVLHVEPLRANIKALIARKANISAPAPTLLFSIEPTPLAILEGSTAPRIVWTGQTAPLPTVEGDLMAQTATELLQAILADGPVDVRVIVMMGRQMGVSYRTLYRAFQALGGTTRREGAGREHRSYWSLPGQQRQYTKNPAWNPLNFALNPVNPRSYPTDDVRSES